MLEKWKWNESKLKNIPTPRNKKKLRAFLGFSNLYRKFISNFATEGQTRKANPENIQWDGASLEAFEKLKQKLNQKPIDCLSDAKSTYTLRAGASYHSITAVLLQKHNDDLKYLRDFQHVPIPFSILGIDNESNTCEGYNSNMRNTLLCDTTTGRSENMWGNEAEMCLTNSLH